MDLAGWKGTWTGTVDTFYVGDRDCDGYPSPEESAGGTDCDDLDPDTHPGAIDSGPEGDRNCDGVPGTDADGDGVAARDQGGADCDDSNPAVHPEGSRYELYPLEVDRVPVLWQPGTASVVWTAEGPALAINHAGVLEVITTAAGGRAERITVHKFLSPGPVAFLRGSLSDLTIFYAERNHIEAIFSIEDGWQHEHVLTLDEFVEQPIARVASVGGLRATAVVARAGRSIHIAIHDGTTWRPWVVDSA